jgi:hypothetical protein
LRFSGPADGLGVPFELLRNERGYPGLRHSLTRQVALSNQSSHKLETFAQLILRLGERKDPLRILLVASAAGGDVSVFDREVEQLAPTIEKDLKQLGLFCTVTFLPGARATHSLVSKVLGEGGFHLFHYAGPVRQRGVPAASGLILREGAGTRLLPDAELGHLVEKTELHLVFLSGWLGGGNFHTVFEALAKADVPTVLSYRWPIPHETALLLATAFYGNLWRTFCPGEALLAARRACATVAGPRKDWASPVLMLQNF